MKKGLKMLCVFALGAVAGYFVAKSNIRIELDCDCCGDDCDCGDDDCCCCSDDDECEIADAVEETVEDIAGVVSDITEEF